MTQKEKGDTKTYAIIRGDGGASMHKQKTLNQYSGRLTTIQAAAGIQAAIKNARSLLADAELLLKNERWERATAISVLAIEEVGKAPILREILLARDGEELKTAWRSYRSHTKKNVLYMFPLMAAKGARPLEDFRPIYDEKSDHGQLLDTIKQLAFYTDACGACHWSIPQRVIEPDLSKTLFALAKAVVGAGPGAFTSEAELDIWVKHMKPVWKEGMNEMKKGLLACYREAHEKGVLQGNKTELEMLTFLFGDASQSVI